MRHVRQVTLGIICYAFILLFVYAAASKLVAFGAFRAQLSQSPLLSAYTGIVSLGVPAVELLIAAALAVPRARYWALVSSFFVMAGFTAYIAIILNFSAYVPCSCGGILSDMGWKEHLVFNIVFVLLGAAGALLAREKGYAKTILLLTGLALASASGVWFLYVSSERAMHHENPFIRRFIQGSAVKVSEAAVTSRSLYFAGTDGKTVYLGDRMAPLHLFAYDMELKTRKHYKIALDREDYPFQSVQVRIAAPYFYLMDGTVPVIYRGLVADWKGKVILYGENRYFSKAVPTDNNTVTFRAQDARTADNVLGLFAPDSAVQTIYAKGLLEKIADGFFDTDGTMAYDAAEGLFTYTYYYRNRYEVADNKLKLLYRGRTIDTTAHPDIKVFRDSRTGDKRLTSFPATINQLTATSHGRLFIDSKLIGKYEPRDTWKQASVIDTYDLKRHTYLSSFYLYDEEKSKPSDLLAWGGDFYAIIGNKLVHYKLNTHLNLKNIPAGTRNVAENL